MRKSYKLVLGIIILAIIVLAGLNWPNDQKNKTPVTIGIVTDLSGPAAYWGQSTVAGAELAVSELRKQGIDVKLIFEDYKLDPKEAANAVQKLTSVDNVGAVYIEFNPGILSTEPILRDKKALYIYDAAVESPLKDNSLAYKTYLDYRVGCRDVAQKFKDQGVDKIGVLKGNMEFGDLCLAGVKEVYKDKLVVEGYNLGDTDFRTQLLKINSAGAGAVINVGFEGETLNTLRIIKSMGYRMKYGTVADTITDNVKKQYGDMLPNVISFGFVDVGPSFWQEITNRNPGKNIASQYGAALAYTHINQLAMALSGCNGDSICASRKLGKSDSDNTIGFEGYFDRIARLKTLVR